VATVLQPCDAGVIRGSKALAPCKPSSRPWIVAAASLGSGMAFLDSTVLNVALPAVQRDLGATAQEVQWIYGAYALVLAALMLLGGALGDRYGRRRVFVLGAAVFGAASVWCALAPGTEQLIIARTALGLGGALLVPGSLAILGASVEAEYRSKAIGLWGGLSGTAMAVGPVVGGLLVEEVSWRAAFLINPALAVAAIVVSLRHVPESRDPGARRLDLPGAALATLGLAGLVYALIESSSSGFGAPAVLGALMLGAISLAAFVLAERRSAEPMVPPALFRSREFDGANLVTLLFYMGLTGSLYFLPFLMMQVHGYSALVAGSVFLPFVAIALVLGRFSGKIALRYGTKVPLMVASLAAATGFLMFAVPGTENGSYWSTFFPAMVVQGFGMALAIAPLTASILDSVEGEHSGLASGVNNAISRVAGLLAVLVLGALLHAAFSPNLDARLEGMDLSGGAQGFMEAQKANLGAAKAPAGVDPGTAIRIEEAIDDSFVAGFRMAMVASAALALASALAAALFVGGDKGLTKLRNAAAIRTPELRNARVAWEKTTYCQHSSNGRGLRYAQERR
jgi:EmrB/QacA subfamily drug resistance transporter